MSEIQEIEYFKYMKETIQNLKAAEIRGAIQTVGKMIDEAIELKNQIGLQMAMDTAESLLTNVENIEGLTLSVLDRLH